MPEPFSPIVAGQRFVFTEPVRLTALTHWSVAYTGGTEVVFPAGELIEVLDDPCPGATAVGCRPVRQAALEPLLIPEADRTAGQYAGYSLSVPLDLIRTRASPVA